MVQWPNACKAPSTDEVLRTLWLHSLMARRSVFHILSGSDPDLLGLGSASPWTLHACLDHPSHLFGPPQCAPWSSPFLSLQDSVLCELVSWSELSPESLRHALTRYGVQRESNRMRWAQVLSVTSGGEARTSVRTLVMRAVNHCKETECPLSEGAEASGPVCTHWRGSVRVSALAGQAHGAASPQRIHLLTWQAVLGMWPEGLWIN